jgi:thiamine transport system permease protein
MPSLLLALSITSAWGNHAILSVALRSIGYQDTVAYGWSGILAAHVFMNFPLFLKATGLALLQSDRSCEITALSLGARRARVFIEMTLPKILPTIARTALLSFAYCSGSFLIVLLLGGGPRFTSLEVAVFQAVRVQFDLKAASIFACVQIITAFFLHSLVRFCPESIAESAHPVWSALYRPRKFRILILGCSGVLFFFVVGMPIFALVADGVSNWTAEIFLSAWPSLLLSITLAFEAGVYTMIFACVVAWACANNLKSTRLMEILASFPAMISTTLLTLGWMLGFGDFFSRMRGNRSTVALIQALIAMPPAFRLVRDCLARIALCVHQSARSCGATPWQIFRFVDIPLAREGLVAAFLVGFGFSMGEVSTLLILMDENLITMPIEIYRRMTQYRFGEASALSLVLVSLLVFVYVIVNRVEKWRLR